MTFEECDIDSLSPGNNQRQFFPGLEELATDIEKSGWIQTLEVSDNTIVAGERRWRAAKLVNARAIARGEEPPWCKLPCMVRILNERGAFDLNVAENMGRVELRFIELAKIFKTYRESYGLDNNEIGQRTGYDPDTVSRYISILEKTHPEIIARLNNGEQIPTELLIKIHTIRDKEVQKLRLEQWLGNPVELPENQKSRLRANALSRRKMVALIKVLQESEASEETIQVAQYMAGMRQTLPKQWQKKLTSRKLSRARLD